MSQKILYKIKRSERAKNARLTVRGNGQVIITLPKSMRDWQAEKMVREKSDWILKSINTFARRKKLPIDNDKRDYRLKKKTASDIIKKRVNYFSNKYGFKFNKITVRNQKSRWGSCSARGNLSFNYKLIYLSEKQRDYIIVHELCHLRELNHSKKFWRLVENIIPDYADTVKELKMIEL